LQCRDKIGRLRENYLSTRDQDVPQSHPG